MRADTPCLALHVWKGHLLADIGENHIVGPARRWAVALDPGELIVVDSDQLAAE
jgi:hypothetical protein